MSYPSNEITRLSGSTLGEPVQIASTGPAGSAGTLIMTVPPGKKGRLELWAWNNSSNPVLLTLQLGTVSAAKELSAWILPKGSAPLPVVLFWPYEAGAEIRGYAGVANVICVTGPFNERTPAA